MQMSTSQFQADSSCLLSHLDSRGLKPLQEDTPQLMRTRSDVGVRRRGNVRTPSDQRRIRRHRFSINGHFYNHKVEGTECQGAGSSPTGAKCLLGQLPPQGHTHLRSQVLAILSSLWVGRRLCWLCERGGTPDQEPPRVVDETAPQTPLFRPPPLANPHCPLAASQLCAVDFL